MNRATRTLSALLVIGLSLTLGASGLWATSAVPEPGALGIPINPNAPGKEISGSMTLTYTIVEDFDCATLRSVDSVAVAAELTQKEKFKQKQAQLFNDTLIGPYCFIDETPEIQFVLDLIAQRVIPAFFDRCVPASQATLRQVRRDQDVCPPFQIKSITDFLSSGTGALSLKITLAVDTKAGDD